MRGYDVEALAYNNTSKFLSYYLNYAFIDPYTRKVSQFTTSNVKSNEECKDWLEKNIKINQRYILNYLPKENSNSSHVVIVFRTNDSKLKFYDPMIGIEYNEDFIDNMKFSYNKNNMQTFYSPSLLRIDDKILNYQLVNKIVKPSQKSNRH